MSVRKKMLIVRKMIESDLEAIASMESAVFSDAWTAKSIEDTYNQSQAFIVTAESEGKIAGYCIVYFVLDEGEIARIAVDGLCRRQGVGRKLLEQVEKICGEKNIIRLMLDVRESNDSARKFYQSFGFEEDGIRKNFYDMPKEDAILMSKMIGSTGSTSH